MGYLKAATEQNFDEMDKYSMVQMEVVHKAIINAAMENSSKSEAEIYEMILKLSFGKKPDNLPKTYQEYRKTYAKLYREQLEEEYGTDYSMSATIISSDDAADDKGGILKEASDYYNNQYGVVISEIARFSEIDEIKRMQCKVYINQSKENETSDEIPLYVVSVNGEWKVLNLN